MVARMRRMAAEFQSQFSEAMREAEVQDLQKDVEKVQDVVSGHLNPLNEISTQVQSTHHEISNSISQLVSTHDIAQDMLTMPDVAHMVEPEHAPAPAASVAPVDAPPQKPNAQV
jgi:sec-independent protein translocase protein TatB